MVGEGPALGHLRAAAGGEGRVPFAHLVEDLGRAPAVEQDVVERPQQADPVRCQPDQRQPHQGRGAQVDAGQPVLGEQPVQLARLVLGGPSGPVEVGDGHGGPVPDDLERFRGLLPHQAGAQHRVGVGGVLPGLGERVRVGDAGQYELHLVDVGAAGGVQQAVEEHARLHRRQRVDVGDVPAVPGDPVHGALVQAGQREVRRGTAARVRAGAVGDDVGEGPQHALGERGDGLLAVPSGAVVPGDLQPVVLDPGHDVQQVRPLGAGRLRAAEAAGHGPDQGAALGGPVEAAQVVEADAGRGRAGEPRVAGQVAQDAVAEPPVGYGA